MVAGASDTITVAYTGATSSCRFRLLNELQYDPPPPTPLLELFNRSTTTPFDLSNFRLQGVATFAEGADPGKIPSGAGEGPRGVHGGHGATICLRRIPRSLTTAANSSRSSARPARLQPNYRGTDVRYDNTPPWPTNAAGSRLAPTVDAAQDDIASGIDRDRDQRREPCHARPRQQRAPVVTGVPAGVAQRGAAEQRHQPHRQSRRPRSVDRALQLRRHDD